MFSEVLQQFAGENTVFVTLRLPALLIGSAGAYNHLTGTLGESLGVEVADSINAFGILVHVDVAAVAGV